MKPNTTTLAMKARVYNQIRTALYKRKLDTITPKEKIELFDKIFEMNHVTHWELNDYKHKRQRRSVLQAEREARGWKPKKKISKEEYEKKFGDSK